MPQKDNSIYTIKNIRNNRIYVGATTSIYLRWSCHKALLRHGKHTNSCLQQDWNYFGEEAFVFEVLEKVRDHNLLGEREVYWINIKNKQGSIYNKTLASLGLNNKNYTTDTFHTIRLDEQARQDAEYLMKRHNISSVSAAVRFALRELVRRYEQEKGHASEHS